MRYYVIEKETQYDKFIKKFIEKERAELSKKDHLTPIDVFKYVKLNYMEMYPREYKIVDDDNKDVIIFERVD